MLAARWDSAADLSSGWSRTFRRRTADATPENLAMAAPVSVQAWGPDGAIDDEDRPLAPLLDVPGSISPDALNVTVTLSPAHLALLGVGNWEIAIIVTDPLTDLPIVLTRGYLRVVASAEQW